MYKSKSAELGPVRFTVKVPELLAYNLCHFVAALDKDEEVLLDVLQERLPK